MRYSVLLVALLIFVNQYADSTAIGKEVNDLSVYNNERGIKDIWENVKASIQTAWNAVKNVAHNTKEKIDKWRDDLKERAEELAKEFEKRIENIKQKIKEILQNIRKTGELVKKCVKEQDEALEAILKEIMKDTLQCVRQNINKLSTIENHQIYLKNAIDETEYLNQVENQLEACATDEENALECFHAIRKEAFDDSEELERDILIKRVEARSTMEDILDSIVACTTQGILETSAAVADNTIHFVDCVKNGNV